jgi:hypothetical protein
MIFSPYTAILFIENKHLSIYLRLQDSIDTYPGRVMGRVK